MKDENFILGACFAKISKKVSKLEGIGFCLGGYLIPEVLNALSMYFTSLFSVPRGIVEVMQRSMRDFLWDGDVYCHMVE